MIRTSKHTDLITTPYRHTFSTYCIEDSLYNQIINWLEENNNWVLVEAGFYVQYEINMHKVVLPSQLKFIVSKKYLSYLKSYIEDIYNVKLLEKYDVVAHKLIKGHVIKIHNDYLGDQSPKESHRLLFHFNRDWSVEKGGLCMVFSDGNAENVVSVISPEGKLMQSFEISKHSHHAVSEVYHGNRLTIIFTFYS